MPVFIEQRKSQRPISKDIVVLYHASCSDGFGSAWAAWHALGDRAEYIPVEDHDTPPAGIVGKEVYMIDFTYNGPALEKLMKENTRVTAIDHHESVERETKLTQDYSYDEHHSGAVLAWKYFHPTEAIPELLLVVEDFDLWKFSRPHTHELFAYLDLYTFEFQVWDRLAAEFDQPDKRAELLKTGQLVLDYGDKLVDRLIASGAQLVEFEGHQVYAVNSEMFRPQIAAKLYRRQPPFALIWWFKGDRVMVSIRSDGTFNVAELAKKYGGGGHLNAAGFTVPSRVQFPWHLVSDHS